MLKHVACSFSSSILLSTAISLCAGPQAFGVIVHDGGNPDGRYAGPVSTFVLADDFSLPTTSTLTRCEFWTLNWPASGWNGQLSWFLIADDGGHPNSTPLLVGSGKNIFSVPTGRTFLLNSVSEFYWSFDFDSPIILPAGSVFWFGIGIGDTPVAPGTQGIFWEATDEGLGSPVWRASYNSVSGSFLGGTYLSPPENAAFRLDGSPIPEPATFIIWSALSVVGVAFAWSRKRKCTSPDRRS